MKRRIAIAAAAACLLLGLGGLAGSATARDCGPRCGSLAEYRQGDRQGDYERFRRFQPPYPRGPNRDYYSGPGERYRYRTVPSDSPYAREPLSDVQIWSIARSRVPGRIVNARLHGSAYSFRIISNRGSVVDLVVDRYSGRILSVDGGP